MDQSTGGLAEEIPGGASQEPKEDSMAVDSHLERRPLDPKEAAAWKESEEREEARIKAASQGSTDQGAGTAPGTPKGSGGAPPPPARREELPK
eukprot:15230992-Heterocapsa_arctica.AAC.1